MHDAIEEVLKALSFSVHQVKFVKETARALLIEPQKLKKEQHQNRISKLHELNEKIFKLEERLMNHEIESSTYQPWFQNSKKPTFNDNILKVKQKGLLFNEQPFKVLGLSPVSTQREH